MNDSTSVPVAAHGAAPGATRAAAEEAKAAAPSDALERLLGTARSIAEPLGRVVRASGTTVHATGLAAGIGTRCAIGTGDGGREVLADVVGIAGDEIVLCPLGSLDGIACDSMVRKLDTARTVGFSPWMTGCVLDGHGDVVSGGETMNLSRRRPLESDAPDPMTRAPIERAFETGVRAIDALLTVGVGQRMGIFAMAGAGKSTLLAMLARHATADVIVIGLIGERGREVREFLERSIGAEGMRRCTVVVATSDRPAMERVTAAQAATAIAEGFREVGRHVLLLMDSITRYARALREVGLSAGELPVRRGYPPSVFAALPKLFERTGNDDRGSITAFYTVLAEDEDNTDPVAEEVRSILDGHIVLSRELGEAGRYPAIDPLASVSRLFNELATPAHRRAAIELRRLLAKHRDVEFLVQIGEYEAGSDPVADRALAAHAGTLELLEQDAGEAVPMSATVEALQRLVGVPVESASSPSANGPGAAASAAATGTSA